MQIYAVFCIQCAFLYPRFAWLTRSTMRMWWSSMSGMRPVIICGSWWNSAQVGWSRPQSLLYTCTSRVSWFHDGPVQCQLWADVSLHLLSLIYVSGGSLQTIITQDDHLPESAVKGFGIDIVKGLHHIHSLGIIFSDIRPSKVNMGIFEYFKFLLLFNLMLFHTFCIQSSFIY